MVNKSSKAWRIAGGLGGIYGGALLLGLILFTAGQETELEGTLLGSILPTFALGFALGTVGMGQLFHKGWLSKVGLWIGGLGALTLAAGMWILFQVGWEAGWWIFLGGILGQALGLLLYGIPVLLYRPLWKLNWVPLGMGLLSSIDMGVEFLTQWEGDTSFLIWAIAMGAGWVILGILILMSKPGQALEKPEMFSIPRKWVVGGGLVAAVGGFGFYQYQSICRLSLPETDLSAPVQQPRRVIFDTDMAHEDMFAGLFLLQHPEIEVEAITVAGTGETHCEPGVRHVLGLVALQGGGAIPVACGRETPLQGDHEFPEEWRTEVDRLYGLSLPEGGTPSPLSAPELIAETVKNSPEPVSIVAVGPLTNVAEAVQQYPEIIPLIESIFIMGGAINVGGNVERQGVGGTIYYAEWNIYADPHAANIVLGSGVPVTLVPLDATGQVPITTGFYHCLDDRKATPEAGFVDELIKANLSFVRTGFFHFWDSLTAAIFTDESLATYEMHEIKAVEAEGLVSGYTKSGPGGYPVRVAVTANKERFEGLFLQVLNLETP